MGIARPSMPKSRRSATIFAPSTGVMGRMIANSSPPYRAAKSPGRSNSPPITFCDLLQAVVAGLAPVGLFAAVLFTIVDVD